MKPTAEQVKVIESISGVERLKINAGAGCAKTTTLRLIAEANEVKSLYLVFNKKNEIEAKEKFPSWVEVRTTHSLAYSAFGRELQHKLKRPVGQYINVCGTGTEIAKALRITDFIVNGNRKISANGVGLAVKETLNRFEFSADRELSHKHVSFSPVGSLMTHKKFNRDDYSKEVLRHAKVLWDKRTDPTSFVLATHDTYLKLYQLSNPDLSAYATIYLDEAQDTNMCVLDIVSRQTSKIVLVGDEHQQIYAWRGSVNAMEKFEATSTNLSKSFRFGKDIATVANKIIAKDFLVGHEDIDTTIARHSDELGKYTVLYRTNIALIFAAVDLLKTGKKINLEFDTVDFVRYLESAVALFRGEMNKVKHENLLPYTSWEDLKFEAEYEGGELGRVVTIIESKQYVRILALIKEHENTNDPDVILTTAHKSKGREWDVVVLAEDFPSPLDEEGRFIGLSPEETNLLYVAVTRAKKKLVYNETVEVILTKRHQTEGSGISLQLNNLFLLQGGFTTEKDLENVSDMIDARSNNFGDVMLAIADDEESTLPFAEEMKIREKTKGMFDLVGGS